MNQEMKTREFYNNYGMKEWERLDKSAYDKLNFLLHMDFINDYLKEGVKVFDVGCGAGRYSIEIAKQGCDLTILDISDKQLEIAKTMLRERELITSLNQSYRASISDMNMVEDNTFDLTVCYGAPLNYLFKDYIKGIRELYRVTKPGGRIVISVNSRLGVFRGLLGRENFDTNDFFGNSEYWHINQVLNTGDLPEHPKVAHPARHFFNAKELENLFTKVGFKDIELASSPCILSGMSGKVEDLYTNEPAWETILNLELKSYKRRELADSGEFLLLRGIK